jgi:AraC-like DNA-binding protein
MTQLLNIVYIINAIAAVHGIFLALIIWKSNRENRNANRILTVFMLFCSFGMGFYAYLSSGFYRHFPHLVTMPETIIYVFPPLLFFYIKALTSRGFRITGKQWLHFVPAVLVFIYFIPLLLKSGAEKILFFEEAYGNSALLYHVLMLGRILQISIYIILGIRLLKIHALNVKESFSNVDKVNLSWMRHLLYGFLMIWIAVVALHSLLSPELLLAKMDDAVIFLLLALFVFTIGYRGMSQPEIFSDIPENSENKIETDSPVNVSTGEVIKTNADAIQTPPSTTPAPTPTGKKYERTGLSPENAEALHQRLLDFMIQQRPYLEPDLTLAQLAGALAVPSHHLSQVLNEKLNQNFFKFINSYRLEEAKQKLSHTEFNKEKLLKIAFDVGFNSLSTFNRVFKELTKVSPSEYRRRHQGSRLKTV